MLLDRYGTILTDNLRQQDLMEYLNKSFSNFNKPSVIKKILPRELKYFNVPTKVNFEFNPETQQHMMVLETLDQPALLARVGQVFLQHEIEVHFARITTLGERVEDMFLISDQHGGALADDILERLKNDLIKILQI